MPSRVRLPNTSASGVCGCSGCSFDISIIRSTAVSANFLPRAPAGITAKTAGEMPRAPSIPMTALPMGHRYCRAGSGARFRGQPRGTTPLTRANEESVGPTMAMPSVPRRVRCGRASRSSAVSLLLETCRQTSSVATTPRSSYRASVGLRNSAINPMEENVAVIMRATAPVLPTPVIPSLAFRSAQLPTGSGLSPPDRC